MFSDGGRLRALRREKPGLLWLQIGPADLGTGDDSPRSSVARPHDIRLLDDLVEGFAGLVPADKGFFDAYRHAGWPRDMAY